MHVYVPRWALVRATNTQQVLFLCVCVSHSVYVFLAGLIPHGESKQWYSSAQSVSVHEQHALAAFASDTHTHTQCIEKERTRFLGPPFAPFPTPPARLPATAVWYTNSLTVLHRYAFSRVLFSSKDSTYTQPASQREREPYKPHARAPASLSLSLFGSLAGYTRRVYII